MHVLCRVTIARFYMYSKYLQYHSVSLGYLSSRVSLVYEHRRVVAFAIAPR